jgi:hypothetical protein
MPAFAAHDAGELTQPSIPSRSSSVSAKVPGNAAIYEVP